MEVAGRTSQQHSSAPITDLAPVPLVGGAQVIGSHTHSPSEQSRRRRPGASGKATDRAQRGPCRKLQRSIAETRRRLAREYERLVELGLDRVRGLEVELHGGLGPFGLGGAASGDVGS